MKTKEKINVDIVTVAPDSMSIATMLQSLEMEAQIRDTQIKAMREALLESLQKQGVRRVDLENGDSYVVYPRNKLVIKDKMAAMKWATENPEARMKLDNSAAIEVAQTGKLKWAKVEQEEYLRISRAKSE